MVATLIVSIISIFLGYLARFRCLKYTLEIAFLVITFFLSIRYEWGNDMPEYVKSFNEFTNFVTLFDFHAYSNYRLENGWITLNIFCKPIGFLGMQILLAIVQNYIIYSLVKEHVHPNWYWLSLFIYCMDTSFMVLSSSMMRQFLAMSVFMYASKYIVERNLIFYVLLVLLATSFHHSALMLLPLFLVGYWKYNLSNFHIILIIILFVLWFLFSVELVGGMVVNMAKESVAFKQYALYLSNNEKNAGTGLIVMFKLILLFFVFMNFKKMESYTKVYAILFSISLLFVPFIEIAPLIMRLGFYFSIFSIIVYPVLMEKMENKWIRVAFLNGILFMTLLGFFNFFASETWHDHFYKFETIFEYSY